MTSVSGTNENVRLKARVQELESKLASEENNYRELSAEAEELRQQLERARLISDYANDWEMWFLPDSTIDYISPSFQTITGYAPQELINNSELLSEIVHHEDYEQFIAYVADSIAFVTIRESLRFRILTRTRQIRWCEIKCKSVYDRRGKYLGQRASIGDITRLMQALGQIKDLTDGRQYEEKAKKRYIRELENKERELVSFLMIISQKNEALQYARRHIEKLMPGSSSDQLPVLKQVHQHLADSLQSQDSWESFKSHFENLNPGFFTRLSRKFPTLSSRDLRICGYIRMGLSTKEIAVLQNITFQSAEISRVRLRKKLQLTRNVNLARFLSSV